MPAALTAVPAPAPRWSFLAPDPARLTAFSAQVAARLARGREVLAARAGVGLGLYEGLVAHGPVAAPRLAAALELDAEYVAEWLAGQVRVGFVRRDAADRHFLDRERAAVFADAASPVFLLGYPAAELPAEKRGGSAARTA